MAFIVWFAVMAIHVLGHVQEAALTGWRELRARSPRRQWRFAALAAALLIGVGGAAVLLPHATHWTHRSHDFEHDRPR